MKSSYRWSALVAALGLGLGLAATEVDAGRIVGIRDAGYEITRVVSEYRGGASETIAPWETEPALPVEGEAVFYGTSNLFPEFGKVFVWNGERYVELDPSSFTFKADAMPTGPEGTRPAFATASFVVFRFPRDKVNLIQNRFVLFQIFPMPSTDSPGDTVEGLFVRRP